MNKINWLFLILFIGGILFYSYSLKQEEMRRKRKNKTKLLDLNKPNRRKRKDGARKNTVKKELFKSEEGECEEDSKNNL